MINFLRPRLARLLWRRFHPIVRFGWLLATREGARITSVRRLGFGMMLVGLTVGRRRRKLLYATTVPADQSVRVRVVRHGRTIAAG